MAFNVSAYINDTVLCGKKGFVIWDNETNSFGHCFQDLVLLIPTQVDNQKNTFQIYLCTQPIYLHC